MPNKEIRERALFAFLMVLGLIGCFVLPPMARHHWCELPPQETIRVADRNGANKGDFRFSTVFCREMKITDLSLVFFTYGLFLVGWFAMRSNERTVELQQRAYL